MESTAEFSPALEAWLALAWTIGGDPGTSTWRTRKAVRDAMTAEVMQEASASGNPALERLLETLYCDPYDSFEPRPDDLAAGDEQTGFYESSKFVTFGMGGNGCLGGEQEIYDPHQGRLRRVDSISEPWHVLTANPAGGIEQAAAIAPWIKGTAAIYRWTFSSGETLTATAEHRVVDASGQWVTLADAYREGRTLTQTRPATSQERSPSIPLSSARRSTSTLPDYQGHCSCGSCLCDEPLPTPGAAGLAQLPPLGDARARSRQNWPQDAQGEVAGYTRPYPRSARRETSRLTARVRQWAALRSQPASTLYLPASLPAGIHAPVFQSSTVAIRQTPAAPQSGECSALPLRTIDALPQEATDKLFSLTHPARFDVRGNGSVQITQCEYLRTGPYYDLETPPHANYLCAGLINANSGKTYVAAQRCIAFVCERQPPPIPDTPFWILGPDLELCCKVAWTQKLATMIPSAWIDWDRITWQSEKRNYPRAVPLKPWPGRPGKNWVLEFHSYEQGREAMQGTAIGGAWFTEQYPVEIFEEVLRGMREWAFPGSVWAEFTPIDPAMSVEVEEMYTKWQAGDVAYKNYGFHHLNTTSALNAGHVQPEWYDTYFAGVSEDMQETRKRGVFASYKGQIYKGYRPGIHCWDGIEIPSGVTHRRAMDWGSSEEHPFVCLWGFKDAVGCWYIYDEYWNNDQSKLWVDHIEAIHSRRFWDNASPYYRDSYGDPSRPDLIREFSHHGIPITAARNDVDEGIERVRLLLKINPATEQPQLIIDRTRCPKLAKQMQTYRWETGAVNGLNPKAAKPKPLKKNDDAVDALRYLIFSEYKYDAGEISATLVEREPPKQLRFRRGRR